MTSNLFNSIRDDGQFVENESHISSNELELGRGLSQAYADCSPLLTGTKDSVPIGVDPEETFCFGINIQSS